ncbi:MAG: VCBS repeat-containing protein, partial [Elusimicrobia bacterium]|nr:VCBS repeat-containing protein [Elusimicrobiota bacterium]
RGSVAIGNYDGDGPGNNGDADIVVAGFDGNSTRFLVLENLINSSVSSVANHRPSAPTGLSAAVVASTVTFSWTAPSGDETPANGIDYQIQVATEDFSLNPATMVVSGVHGTPMLGNYPNATLAGGQKGIALALPDGASYYWRVRAVDAALSQSAYVAPASPVYVAPIPPNAVTDLAAVAGAQVSLSWTAPSAKGDGKNPVLGYDVFYSSASNPDPNNLSSSDWTKFNVTVTPANPGQPQQLSVTGLTPEHQYYFAVRAFNDKATCPTAGVTTGTAGHFEQANYLIDISSGMNKGGVAWGDLNNDGHLDFVVAGSTGNSIVTQVYYWNASSGAYELQQQLVEGMDEANISLGDYDGDGYLDMAIRGRLVGADQITRNRILIYHNRGASQSSGHVFDTPLDSRVSIDSTFDPGTWGQIQWADLDANGSPDLVIMGSQPGLYMLKNNPIDHSFRLVLISTESQNATGGAVAVADVNNDGLPDIAISSRHNTCLLINDGPGNGFHKSWEMEGLTGPALAWGDYNNDGFWDLAVTGYTQPSGGVSVAESKIIAGNGTQALSSTVINLSTAVHSGSQSTGMMAWADINNDGWQDLIVTGALNGPLDPHSFLIYKNEGATAPGTFDVVEWPFGQGYGLYDGSMAAADFDNDGDTDLLIMGQVVRASQGNLPALSIMKNLQVDFGGPSAPPLPAPQNLSAGFNATTGLVEFHFDPPAYNAALKKGLSYNVYLMNRDASTTVVSDALGTPLQGLYMLHSTGTVTLRLALADNTNYRWHVQAIDTSLHRGTYSSDNDVSVPAIPPAVITDLAAGPGMQVHLTWTATGEDGRIGTPSRYRIYYATYSFNAATDPNVTLYALDGDGLVPPFSEGGSPEARDVPDLKPNQVYYFRAAGEDRNGAFPALSNVAIATATIFEQYPMDSFTGMSDGAVAMGDLNNDGRMDVVSVGQGQSAPVLTVLMAQAGGGFSQTTLSGAGLKDSALALVDLNRDGSLDLVESGVDGSGATVSKIYLNNGAGVFTSTTSTLPGFSRGAFAVGDMDGDGDLDIVAAGAGLDGIYEFENVVHGSTFQLVPHKIYNVALSSGVALALADVDGNGLMDIAAAGWDGSYPRMMILSQTTRGGFDVLTEPFGNQDGYTNASLAWGDFNQDGKWDLAAMGQRKASNGETSIFEQKSDGSFVQHTLSVALHSNGSGSNALAVADLNNDGFPDVAVAGYNPTGTQGHVSVFINDGQGFPNGFLTWPAQEYLSPNGLTHASVAAGDVDNDGDVDLVMNGLNGANRTITYLRNYSVESGLPPITAPSAIDLHYALLGTQAAFDWALVNGATDGPRKVSYNYDFWIEYKTSGDANRYKLVTPQIASPMLGNARVMGLGPLPRVSKTLTLSDVTTYYVKIRAVDPGLKTGAWSTETSFYIDNVPPGNITDLVATPASKIELSWTAPGANATFGQLQSYDVRQSTNSIDPSNVPAFLALRQVPAIPAPHPAGMRESLMVTGLVSGTTYFFAVRGYNGTGSYTAISTAAVRASFFLVTQSTGSLGDTVLAVG